MLTGVLQIVGYAVVSILNFKEPNFLLWTFDDNMYQRNVNWFEMAQNRNNDQNKRNSIPFLSRPIPSISCWLFST